MLAGLSSLFLLATVGLAQVPVQVIGDVQYSEVAPQSRRNSLDLYMPKVSGKPPVVMFVHGGSWMKGKKDSYSRLGKMLARNGYACAVINTQMYPFVRPDVMVGDCGRALSFLHSNGERFGFDSDRLFVMGHSSGAHLVSWLSLDDDKLRQFGVPKRALRGAILLSGVYDVRSRHAAIDVVFGKDAAFRTDASPWLYADATDAPIFVAWAQRDLPGLALCARMLRDRMQQLDVPVTSMRYLGCNHVDYVYALGSSRDVIGRDILQFLKNPKQELWKPSRSEEKLICWIAANQREKAVGLALHGAMRPHNVEVIVQVCPELSGEAVGRIFRQVVADRGRDASPCAAYLAGLGQGGFAVTAAPLDAKSDGLAGRIVATVPLGKRSLRLANIEPSSVDLERLRQSGLLCLIGDQDPKAIRQDMKMIAGVINSEGRDAHPIVLHETTAEEALLKIQPDDQLLTPLILAFMRPN